MIDEIVKAQGSSAVLDRIKSMPCEGLEKEVILPLLRNAVNLKLMIQEDTQTDIRKLVIMSIKRQDLRKGNLPDEVIQRRYKEIRLPPDHWRCRKGTAAYVYREGAGIAMEDDEASDIENLDELADAVIRHLKGENDMDVTEIRSVIFRFEPGRKAVSLPGQRGHNPEAPGCY